MREPGPEQNWYRSVAVPRARLRVRGPVGSELARADAAARNRNAAVHRTASHFLYIILYPYSPSLPILPTFSYAMPSLTSNLHELSARSFSSAITPNATQRTTLLVAGCYILIIGILWCVPNFLSLRGSLILFISLIRSNVGMCHT